MGCIAVRPEADAQWIEHFYLERAARGQGVGGAVLRHVLSTRRDARPFRLMMMRGSAARRLHEREGFTHLCHNDNGIDEILHAAGAKTARTGEPGGARRP